MATEARDFQGVLEKLKASHPEDRMDLSSEEDLCIGVMNLISAEEHLFFTGEKTGKDDYFGILNTVRQIRKDLLTELIREHEGEVWCIEKHLLSAAMRLMEVGTKKLQSGDVEKAKDLFRKSYTLYSLFWAIKLKGSVQSDVVQPRERVAEMIPEEQAEFNRKLCELVSEHINCCVE
jgi:hypothetical protein